MTGLLAAAFLTLTVAADPTANSTLPLRPADLIADQAQVLTPAQHESVAATIRTTMERDHRFIGLWITPTCDASTASDQVQRVLAQWQLGPDAALVFLCLQPLAFLLGPGPGLPKTLSPEATAAIAQSRIAPALRAGSPGLAMVGAVEAYAERMHQTAVGPAAPLPTRTKGMAWGILAATLGCLGLCARWYVRLGSAGGDATPRSAPTGRVAWVVLAAAACFAASDVSAYLNADAVIPLLVSLQKWTPFYWGGHRFGMLVPLLTAWSSDPSLTLTLQLFIDGAANMGAWFALAHYLEPESDWRKVGLVTGLLMLLSLTGEPLFFCVGCTSPIPLSLLLGSAGLALLESPGRLTPPARFVGATILVCLALWANAGAPLPLGALWLGRRLTQQPSGSASMRSWSALAMLVVLAAGTTALLQLFPDGNPYFETIPVSNWGKGIASLAESCATAAGARWVLVHGLALGAAALSLRQGAPLKRAGLIFIVAGLGPSLVTALNQWVALNGWSYRYVLNLSLVASLVVARLVVEALDRSAPRSLQRLLQPALLIVALVTFTPAGNLRARLTHPDIAAVREQGCTHIWGDYWKVWPAVVALLEERRGSGDVTPIWGVSGRGEETEAVYQDLPPEHWRFCRI